MKNKEEKPTVVKLCSDNNNSISKALDDFDKKVRVLFDELPYGTKIHEVVGILNIISYDIINAMKDRSRSENE